MEIKMRFNVPIMVGNQLLDSHYCVICYNNGMKCFLAIFYQKDDCGQSHPIRKVTSRRLNDVLGESIDWVEENLEVVRFRKADEARNG
jgi:hypothetical protein